MEPFLLGYATGTDADGLVRECLRQMESPPAGTGLGFVYATDALANELPAIVRQLQQATGIRQWVGTVGMGICVAAREFYDSPALAIMLADFPADQFRCLCSEKRGIDRIIADHQEWYRPGISHFGIVHGDPTNPLVAALLERLAETVPGGFLVGGLTSSNSEYHPQVAAGVVSGGVSGVLFNQEVAVAAGHTQGCTPIAERHEITRCDRNVIAQLDGRPALDVFKEDIGEVLSHDLERIGGYIFAALPIASSDTGDYQVRNLLGIDTHQKLLAVGEYLQEGDKLMFCRRDGNTARQDMFRMLDDIAGRIPATPRGAVYYSCLARGRNQFGDNAEELNMIRERLGDIPVIGFFANGEIFHNRLYGYTGVLAVFT